MKNNQFINWCEDRGYEVNFERNGITARLPVGLYEGDLVVRVCDYQFGIETRKTPNDDPLANSIWIEHTELYEKAFELASTPLIERLEEGSAIDLATCEINESIKPKGYRVVIDSIDQAENNKTSSEITYTCYFYKHGSDDYEADLTYSIDGLDCDRLNRVKDWVNNYKAKEDL